MYESCVWMGGTLHLQKGDKVLECHSLIAQIKLENHSTYCRGLVMFKYCIIYKKRSVLTVYIPLGQLEQAKVRTIRALPLLLGKHFSLITRVNSTNAQHFLVVRVRRGKL